VVFKKFIHDATYNKIRHYNVGSNENVLECPNSDYMPIHVLQDMNSLEHTCMRLIENNQEATEENEMTHQHYTNENNQRSIKLKRMKHQLTMMESTLVRTEERVADYTLRCKMYELPDVTNDISIKGLNEVELTNHLLKDYGKKITELYSTLPDTGKSAIQISIDLLQMLLTVESKLEEIFDLEEMCDPMDITHLQRQIDKKRRNAEKEEWGKMQSMRTLERMLRAQKRAMYSQKKGRKLMKRSKPQNLTYVVERTKTEHNNVSISKDEIYFL